MRARSSIPRALVGRVAGGGTLLLLLLAATPARPDPPCGVTHIQLGDYPVLAWTPWSVEAQGVTHDERHWFVSNRTALFKIPASADLASDLERSPGTLRAPMPEALTARGFDHFGDLSWHEHAGTGLLCVAVDGGGSAALAFFRASDLLYLGAARLPAATRSVPFCAIDGWGYLVIGQRMDPVLGRFRVDWGRVAAGSQPFALEVLPGIRLLDERGRPIRIEHPQGAAFSQHGRLLHLTSGFWNDHACPPWRWAFWSGGCPSDPRHGGIHVFEVRSAIGGPCDSAYPCEAARVDKSTNPTLGAALPSSFTYPYRGTLRVAEEPEGITVWDLEAAGSPVVRGVRGQVHALLLDNELPSRSDRVSIHHYRIEEGCGPGR